MRIIFIIYVHRPVSIGHTQNIVLKAFNGFEVRFLLKFDLFTRSTTLHDPSTYYNPADSSPLPTLGCEKLKWINAN